MATSLERAGFDYMMLEDSSVIPDIYQGSYEFSLKRAVLRQDPMPLVPLLAAATRHVGIIATASTSFYPPYMAARLFATLDHLTEGRVGMNLVTSSPHAAAQNYGYEEHFDHDVRYEMADEWVECVQALWDGWEPGSVVKDEETGVFADHTKVHRANFEGKYYRSRGPLNTPPGPQGRPVICQAGGSDVGKNFGAKYADTIIASLAESPGVDNMKRYREDMTERIVALGRKPSEVKLLFLAQPVLSDSEQGARDRLEQMQLAAAADTEGALYGLSYFSGVDFSKFDLDAPLPDLSDGMNGHRSLVAAFAERAAGKTLREALAERAKTVGSVELVGTPESVAARMGEIMEEVGGDGFLIRTPVTRRNITEVTDGLAPALRRRGLIRSSYTGTTLRENLLAF
jgi:FMN-dependent oxidoreductase (nitrilotriacetate monooxygenase family)